MSKPLALASIAESVGPSDVTPLSVGLKPTTRSPRSRSAMRIAAAITVLPTPVSVPVTSRSATEDLVERLGERIGNAAHLVVAHRERQHDHDHVSQRPDVDAVPSHRQTDAMADALGWGEAALGPAIRDQLDPAHQARLTDLSDARVDGQR